MLRHRPTRLLASVAAALALCLGLAACGGSSDRSSENPNTVLKEATLRGIESGVVNLSISVDASGKEAGQLEASVSGPFESEGSVNLPLLDLNAEAKGQVNGKPVDFEGGVTLRSGAAYVNYEGTEYEIDPSTLSFAESFINPIEFENGVEKESPGPVACEEEAGKLKVADFVAKPKNEGSAEVEGTTTTKVSGELNASGALVSLLPLTKNASCKNQLSAVGAVPSKAEIEKLQAEATGGLEEAHVDVYVGNDDIVRRVTVKLEGKPKAGAPSSAEIDLTLSGVNEEQTITTPKNAKPASQLFQKLGVNPLALLGELQGGPGSGGPIARLEELAGVQQR